ncbi:MAG: secondary thiamine-phosphate synthase enzyme YjbQ [Deltaproteobacteria bacterium]|nr:secondary thiamine-phosphate synthase enzyme YjbQ [Deltaproteobacteria bacterium]
MHTINLNTSSRIEFLNITAEIRRIIIESGLKEGIAIAYVPHTTAGITINEAADPDVVSDINRKLSQLVPVEATYQHSEGNSDAHIKASLMGSSTQIIVIQGKPILGQWQGIFFCEFDGPRRRKVFVKTISD